MADPKRHTVIFIPRSVLHKKPVKGKQCKEKHSKQATSDEHNYHSHQVKGHSSQQRWPAAGEPVCIICNKYGEYICDETEEDVCSLQCKAKHLASVNTQNDKVPTEIEQNSSSLPCFDEHYSSHVTYNPSADIASISENEMSVFREKLQITTKGINVPKLILNFEHCLFSRALCENLTGHGFATPTAVQMQVVPAVLSGRNLLVSACTSSGKTASFILPIIHNIYTCVGSLPSFHEFCKYPIALILAPTRELSNQIEETAKVFAKSVSNIRTALLIGGMPLPLQLHRLKDEIQIVVGTPGRISDILRNHHGVLQLKNIKMVVLDEVDVMLQMGFHNQIQSIVGSIPCKPQYMMFSATIPPVIESFASSMMTNSICISVGPPGMPNKSIKQIVLWVNDVSKKKKLFSIIGDEEHFLPPAIVFVDSKLGANLLSEAISKKFALHCDSIHSDKCQRERNQILQNFLAGCYDILVATNVMGRGIDLLNVQQVILFDMPNSIEEYVHQIGRAGGLTSSGFAISFINNSSKKMFVDLQELFEACGNKLPEEVLRSPHLNVEREKREKRAHMKTKRWNNNNTVNTHNLLQILTKNR